ncbi:MAG: aldo/keto reductase [Planctomycetaceae bacterium]|nr:aldo/keto reductase [Planctomycetaceae bacterium]
MDQRQLGKRGPAVSILGYGAFKIGRNEKTKYGTEYPLPDDATVSRLLNNLLDLGINYIDTAPAYGLSEQRIGQAISKRRDEFVLSTKIGEDFDHGISTYDFSRTAIEQSVQRSLKRLQTDRLDLVFIHAAGDDLKILNQTDAVETLLRLRATGAIRQIGLSAKTAAGARASFAWADVIMVEYHLEDQSQEAVIADAAVSGIGVVVKKALASGKLSPADGLRFVLCNTAVSTAVIGTLNLEHMRSNLDLVNGLKS